MYSAAPHNAVVSTDAAGMLELWDPVTLALPHSITFKFKSDTGLYDLAKAKTHGKSIEVLPMQASPHTPAPAPHTLPPQGVAHGRLVQCRHILKENPRVSHCDRPPLR